MDALGQLLLRHIPYSLGSDIEDTRNVHLMLKYLRLREPQSPVFPLLIPRIPLAFHTVVSKIHAYENN